MPAPADSDPAILQQVMQADLHRLRSRWRKLQRSKSPNESDVSRWETAAQQSNAQLQRRIATLPQLKYDDELPIAGHREEIIQLLATRQTIVICGETGSGKSTQLPKICLEAGLGQRGIIGHTQPRRLAARAVAKRVAEELGTTIGGQVGFKVRFTDTTRPES